MLAVCPEAKKHQITMAGIIEVFEARALSHSCHTLSDYRSRWLFQGIPQLAPCQGGLSQPFVAQTTVSLFSIKFSEIMVGIFFHISSHSLHLIWISHQNSTLHIYISSFEEQLKWPCPHWPCVYPKHMLIAGLRNITGPAVCPPTYGRLTGSHDSLVHLLAMFHITVYQALHRLNSCLPED